MPGPKPHLTTSQIQELRQARSTQRLTYSKLVKYAHYTFNIPLSIKTIYQYINNPYKRGA